MEIFVVTALSQGFPIGVQPYELVQLHESPEVVSAPLQAAAYAAAAQNFKQGLSAGDLFRRLMRFCPTWLLLQSQKMLLHICPSPLRATHGVIE